MVLISVKASLGRGDSITSSENIALKIISLFTGFSKGEARLDALLVLPINNWIALGCSIGEGHPVGHEDLLDQIFLNGSQDAVVVN
jgi:hypothetical protein